MAWVRVHLLGELSLEGSVCINDHLLECVEGVSHRLLPPLGDDRGGELLREGRGGERGRGRRESGRGEEGGEREREREGRKERRERRERRNKGRIVGRNEEGRKRINYNKGEEIRKTNLLRKLFIEVKVEPEEHSYLMTCEDSWAWVPYCNWFWLRGRQ